MTSGPRPWIILSLLCALLYLPGLSALPVMDRDEARFAQATRQMLESGDYVRISFQSEMRAKKPAGVYWLQAASVAALSHAQSIQIWPYRLPSALALWAAVLMTFAFGRSLLGARPAFLGAVLLGATFTSISEAHLAKTDAVLLALTVAAQGLMARFYVAARAKEAAGGGGCGSKPLPGTPGMAAALAFWAVQGLAVLVKGPVVPVISLLTLAALAVADKSVGWVRTMRPLTGAIVAAAIAAPWFAMISQATDGAFVGEAFKQDLLPKLLGAQESHGGWPGQYLLLASLIFWPSSLVLWPALAGLWAQRGRLVYRFLLAWAVPTWIMFELIPTKLPHYVLPALPALALMMAALATEGQQSFHHRLARLWYGVWAVIGLAVAVVVTGAPLRLGAGFDPAFLLVSGGIVLAVGLTAWHALQGRMSTAILGVGVTALVAFPALYQGVIPSLDRLFLSRQVASIVAQTGSDGPVAAAGFSEPSLVFLLGTDTRFVDGAGAANHLAANRRTLVVVGDKDMAAFNAQAQTQGLQTERFGAAQGINYSRGKAITLTVIGLKAP